MRHHKILLSIAIIIISVIINFVLAVDLVIACSEDSDCGVSHLFGIEYCGINDGIYKDRLVFDCNLGNCINNTVPELLNSCQDSFGNWSEKYCKDNDSYHSRIFIDSRCIVFNNGLAGCDNTNMTFQEMKAEECLYGCDGQTGECIHGDIRCIEDLDCGINGFIHEPVCNQNDLFKDYQTFTCLHPNTIESECNAAIDLRLFSDCGDDYCTDFGLNYCKGKDIYKSRTCYDKACLINSCYSNSSVDETLVQECLYGCLSGTCTIPPVNCNRNSDCGVNGYIGDRYCKNHDVYQEYKEFICLNPGTNASICSQNITERLISECDYECRDGECVRDEDEDEENGEHDGFDEINTSDAQNYFKDNSGFNYTIFEINPDIQIIENTPSKTQFKINRIWFIFLIILVVVLIILIIILAMMR